MHNYVGKKFERDLALQFFVMGQPDNSHSASAQNPSERVTAEESLSADKLTLRHVRRPAGSLVAHAARIILEETAIKPKQRTLTREPIVTENQISRGKSRLLCLPASFCRNCLPLATSSDRIGLPNPWTTPRARE